MEETGGVTQNCRNCVTGSYKDASIAAPNDYFGDAFGHASAALWQAVAAAAIEGRNKKIFFKFCLLRLFLLR